MLVLLLSAWRLDAGAEPIRITRGSLELSRDWFQRSLAVNPNDEVVRQRLEDVLEKIASS